MVTMATVVHEHRSWIGGREATDEPRWQRFAAATGLVAAGFMLASYVVLQVAAMPSRTSRLAAWYANDAHRAQVISAWYLVAVGAVFSLWFLGELRGVVRRAEGGEGRLATTAYGGGVASITLFVLGSALIGPIAAAMSTNDFAYDAAVDGHLTQVLSAAAFLVLASAGILAAVLFAAVAVATLRTGVFPRWFGIGAVGAVLLLASGFTLLPVLLIPVWTIVASVLTLRVVSRPERIDLS
jgi:hypothetical protein